MANVIDILVSKQAQAELDKVIASLKVTHEEIIKINQQGLKINSGSSPKNPQQMNQSVKESIALTNQLSDAEQKLLINTKKVLDVQGKQLQNQIKQNTIDKQTIDLKNRESRERERNEKAIAKEEAQIAKLNNHYNRTQQQLNVIQNAYNNLAAKKERYNNLSSFEENRLKTLQTLTEKYNGTLKNVDATIGKHTRNVGNYASAFNPLQNSINQLGREMPAFGNSVQTGFMAISNNLPIFFDAMGQVIAQNKQLQAQGEPTKNVLTQLAGALFSFQTLLSVGVTLLTLYGKEIVSWVSSLWGASEALDELNKNQKEFNKSRIDGQKAAVSERTELDKYVRTMRNTNLADTERLIALEKLRSQYPLYFKDLKNDAMLNGDISKQLRLLNSDLEKKNILEKATEKNVIIKQRLIDLKEELRLNEQIISSNRKELEERRKIRLSDDFETAKEQRRLLVNANENYNKSLRTRNQLQNEVIAYERAIARNTSVINKYKEDAIRLEYTQESQDNKRIDRKKKELKVDEQLIFGTEAWLNSQISALEETRSKTATTSEAYKEIGGAIAYYQKWLETLTGAQKKSNEETEKTLKYGTIQYYESLQNELRQLQQTQVDNNEAFSNYQNQIDFYQTLIDRIKGVKKETEELKKANTDYIDSFINDFGKDAGFQKTFDILMNNIDDFGKNATVTALAITEAFQEAFNTISEASQANFDREFERLAMQKEISIKFAGESTTAREEIERQYEERRRQIERRQAESQKRLAIFNATIDTAQGVIGAIARVDLYPYNFVLAGLIGALGAAQIAMISSQEIPQFWKGTDNAPEGLAWTQEKGAEVITDKNGNIKTLGNDKGAQLTYLSKGDKVYKSREDYINKTLMSAGIQPMGSYANLTKNNSLSKEDFNDGITKLARTFKGTSTKETHVYLNNKKIDTDYFKGKSV